MVSIIKYGILWKWIDSFTCRSHNPLRRYGAFLSDEFTDLEPTFDAAARGLGRLIQKDILWPTVKIFAAGYGISECYVKNLLGPHQFIEVDGRKHTVERCIVEPKTADDYYTGRS